MNGIERRKAISGLLNSHTPVSGTELAKVLGVSRQVIVQDIALMRAEDKNILSTNKGYLLYSPAELSGSCRRVFYVRHTTQQVLDELNAIVDFGGRILDVCVEHDLYGQLRADLIINNRADAEEFVRKLQDCRSAPLKILTDNRHYHTVVADSERLLDLIEQELDKKGFLLHES